MTAKTKKHPRPRVYGAMVPVRMDDDLVAKLDAAAADLGRDRSWTIRFLLLTGLRRALKLERDREGARRRRAARKAAR